MKAKHRREIFIARAVFVVFCLIIVGIIVGLIVFGVSRKKPQEATETQTETQKELIMDFDTNDSITDGTQTGEAVYGDGEGASTVLKTTQRVNLRTEANTTCDVICTLEVGTEVSMLSEEGEWVQVQYNDQTGYIKAEFTEVVE